MTGELAGWVNQYLSDEQLSDMQRELLNDLETGAVMPCCGALRKMRVAAPAREKMITSELIRGSTPQTTWSAGMAATLSQTIAPDTVISFEINPGTLLEFLDTRAEGGPRLKCFEGSVTLVSLGMPHEVAGERLASLVLSICLELRIKHSALASTTWTLQFGAGDTGYEADAAYYIQSHGQAKKQQPPDLAIEVVVSHSEKKALRAGAFLKIPEMWVLDILRHRLTFYRLVVSGKQKGTYRPQPRSRAFSGLLSAEVLERLGDPEIDDTAFHENCRAWARRVLLPRRRAEGG